jgi:hypothetical protein
MITPKIRLSGSPASLLGNAQANIRNEIAKWRPAMAIAIGHSRRNDGVA